MTEYALTLAAIASWCTAPTAPWETNIGSLANGIDSTLINA
jgi:hypothetical protein